MGCITDPEDVTDCDILKVPTRDRPIPGRNMVGATGMGGSKDGLTKTISQASCERPWLSFSG